MGEELSTPIEGLFVFSKKQFINEQGAVFHFLKEADPHFSKIAEVYFSFTNYGFVKGWKRHLEMDQNFIVPVGQMKFVFFDDRENSSTRGKVFEIVIGVQNYHLLKVPHGIWYSFSPETKEGAMIANATSISHAPNETVLKDIYDPSIPYRWKETQS